MTATISIKRRREKPIRNQHPWIFSGAIERVSGSPTPGDLVTVLDADGRFLARGYWNPKSQIQVRILTWRDEDINADWWRRALNRAINARTPYTTSSDQTPASNTYRLINAENDFLPGLIVDRYGDWLVLQALTLGIDTIKDSITQLLAERCDTKGIYERSDVDTRGKEGLHPAVGLLWGEAPPQPLIATDQGRQIQIDVYTGHKTGYYLDQRRNRSILEHLVKTEFTTGSAPNILNLFSYTGGFGVFGKAGGAAKVINVDSSLSALETAEANFQLNNLLDEQVEFIQADVFDYLRDQAAEDARYDIVILDPPKFAHNAQQVEKAARGYKDINLNAFKLINPGGYLMTFSCSGSVSRDLFQKIVFGALADSGRQAQIVRHLSASEDHPIALTFPEGEYLKGLLLRVY